MIHLCFRFTIWLRMLRVFESVGRHMNATSRFSISSRAVVHEEPSLASWKQCLVFGESNESNRNDHLVLLSIVSETVIEYFAWITRRPVDITPAQLPSPSPSDTEPFIFDYLGGPFTLISCSCRAESRRLLIGSKHNGRHST